MENNEIMNEGMEMMEEVVVNEKTGIGTGGAIALGLGLVLAVGAGIKLGKKAYAAYKTKKELNKNDIIDADADDFEDE